MAQTYSADISRRINLEKQHIDADLDAADLKNLKTPSDRQKPTRVRGVSID